MPADQARAHIVRLHNAGMSYRQIAKAAGEDPAALDKLATANPARRTHRDREHRILAARMDLKMMDPPARVPAVGTRRRLQALSWAGWSPGWVAAQLGITVPALRSYRSRPWVRVATARSVATVFDQYAMRRGPSARAAAHAVRQGWVSALAWDEDLIDVPGARPCTADPVVADVGELDPVLTLKVLAGDQVRCTRQERDQLIVVLKERGISNQVIAVRLGISARTVLRVNRQHRSGGVGRAA